MAEFSYEAQEAVICEECDEIPAEHHCLVCDGHLCGPCKDAHGRRKISSSHKIVPLTADLPVYGKCIDHPKHKYDVFCKSCDVPICLKCITEEHNGHEVEDIQVTYSRKKHDILLQISNIDNNIIRNQKQKLENKRTELQEMKRATSTIKTDMISQSERLILHIRKLLEKSLDIVKNIESSEVEDLEFQEKMINETIKSYEELKHELERKVKIRNVSDFLLSIKDLPRVSGVDDISSSYTLPSFVPFAVEGITTESHFGIVIHPKNCNVKRCILENIEEVRKFETEFKTHYGIQCLGLSNIWIRHEGIFMNKLLVSEQLDENIVESGKVFCSTRPSGLCVDKKSVLYSDFEKKQITRVICTEWGPRGICVSKFGYILACLHDTSNIKERGKIVKFSSDGNIMLETSANSDLFSMPAYIAENFNFDICVSDKKYRKVIILDSSANVRFKYDGKISGNSHKPFEPRELDTDSLGNIVVADAGNNYLHLINRDGDFICYFHLNDDLDCPTGLSIDIVDRLWVAEQASKQIKVFKYLK